MRQPRSTQPHHYCYHRPPIPQSLLLFSLITLTSSISLSARRAQTTFILLTNSTNCASSITHSRISTFRRINPSDPTRAFDGILWDKLLIDGAVCQPTLENRARQSTYFRPRQTSPPGISPDEAQPFFLDGRDNSPRKCRTFNTTLPATYLFTDDLPTFRDRFQRQGLIDPGVEETSVRGVVYMFVVPISNQGDLVGRACAYVEADDVVPVSTDVPTTDMPACFPGDAIVNTPTGGLLMRELKHGDLVNSPKGVERVLSFTHRTDGVISSFVELHTENLTIALTKDHLLHVNGRMIPADRVVVGDWLAGQNAGKVERVTEVQKLGLYAPVTESGEMVVQGVVVSCYTSAFREVVAHALLSPVRGMNRVLSWDICEFVDGMRWLWWA